MSLLITEIDNALFNEFPDEVKAKYVGYANEEVVDLAKRKGADPDNILQPLHYKVERFAINVALNLFAQDYVGVNNNAGMGGEDVYKDLFLRTRSIIQETKNSLSLIMFTGGEETPENRAVRSTRLHRG